MHASLVSVSIFICFFSVCACVDSLTRVGELCNDPAIQLLQHRVAAVPRKTDRHALSFVAEQSTQAEKALLIGLGGENGELGFEFLNSMSSDGQCSYADAEGMVKFAQITMTKIANQSDGNNSSNNSSGNNSSGNSSTAPDFGTIFARCTAKHAVKMLWNKTDAHEKIKTCVSDSLGLGEVERCGLHFALDVSAACMVSCGMTMTGQTSSQANDTKAGPSAKCQACYSKSIVASTPAALKCGKEALGVSPSCVRCIDETAAELRKCIPPCDSCTHFGPKLDETCKECQECYARKKAMCFFGESLVTVENME